MIAKNSFNKQDIFVRAKTKWDSKSAVHRAKIGNKYQHVLDELKLPSNNWECVFDDLTESQQNIIVKGELIRTYDSLPSHAKTYIMQIFDLSLFSNKWYKLPSQDKKTLLNYVIK